MESPWISQATPAAVVVVVVDVMVRSILRGETRAEAGVRVPANRENRMICERGARGSGDGLIADYLSSVPRRSDLISLGNLALPGHFCSIAGTSLTLPWPHPVSATYPGDFLFRSAPAVPVPLVRPRRRLVAAQSSRSILEETVLENSRGCPYGPLRYLGESGRAVRAGNPFGPRYVARVSRETVGSLARARRAGSARSVG